MVVPRRQPPASERRESTTRRPGWITSARGTTERGSGGSRRSIRGHVGGDILDPQNWNAYAYAGNNPLRYVDSDGRQWQVPPGPARLAGEPVQSHRHRVRLRLPGSRVLRPVRLRASVSPDCHRSDRAGRCTGVAQKVSGVLRPLRGGRVGVSGRASRAWCGQRHVVVRGQRPGRRRRECERGERQAEKRPQRPLSGFGHNTRWYGGGRPNRPGGWR